MIGELHFFEEPLENIPCNWELVTELSGKFMRITEDGVGEGDGLITANMLPVSSGEGDDTNPTGRVMADSDSVDLYANEPNNAQEPVLPPFFSVVCYREINDC